MYAPEIRRFRARPPAAAADGTVVGTAPDDTVWRRYPQSGWTQLPGRLRRIAIRSANEILGAAPDDRLFSWNGSDWDGLDGRACEVAIGGRPGVAPELWCVNRESQRFWRSAGWERDVAGFPRADRMSLAGAHALCQIGSRLFVKLRD